MITGGFNELSSSTTEEPSATGRAGNGGKRAPQELVDDRFEIKAKLEPEQDFIGANYLGETFLARDHRTNQNVRLLRFNEAIVHYGQDMLNRLKVNMEQAKAVQIPGLAQIVQAQVDPGRDGKRYIAFSYIEGETLRQRLVRGSRLTQQEVIDLMLRLASTVEAADAQQTVCPVLLPETITLGADVALNATLYDLGVTTLTFDHPRFVALLPPEQQGYLSPRERSKERPIPADRVFTLAVIAYDLLFNKPSGQPSANAAAHELESMQRILRSATAKTATVISQALTLNGPYATPRAFVRALLEVASEPAATQALQPSTITVLAPIVVAAPTPIVHCVNSVTGEEQIVHFTGEFVAIGHDPSANQLVLQPDRGIASRHACLWRTAEGRVTLTDIDDPTLGRNRQPTYLGGIRVSPFIAAVVDDQSVVQIANYQITLQASTATIKTAGTGNIATLEPEQAEVTAKAGETLIVPLLLRYHSGKVEEIEIWVEGYPNTWQIVKPGKVRFQEQGEKPLTLRITLPSLAQSAARTYDLILRVISHNLRAQVAADILSITLLPEHTFVCWLEPETIRLYSDVNLFINNQGNLSQTFLIRYADKEAALRFEPVDTRLLVRAGATGLFTFRALPRFWHLWGRERQHPITVTVVPDLGGAPQTKNGQVISLALIPGWVLPFVGILLALVLLLLFTVFKPGFTHRSVESADQSPTGVIITPVAGVPFKLHWSGINDCFYSVYVDDVAKKWLEPVWQNDDISSVVSSTVAGSNVEVQMRNCLFIPGQSWQFQVGAAPTPTPRPLPAPIIKTFNASYTETLVGQTGDLCFGWQVGGAVASLKIEPQVGVLNPTDEQKCVPSTTLFTQPGYFTFTLTAATADGAAQHANLNVHALAPECDVVYDELYLREGPDVTFDPPRVILGKMRTVTVVTRPFYPIDQPGRGWIQIMADPGDPRPGWVDLASLNCARIRSLINGLPAPVIPAFPTATPTPTPTATATPTPTVTPLPGPQITVNIEPKAINAGGCVVVSWDIQNVKEIYLNGEGQVGSGEIQDCPTETKTYNWHIKVKENEFIDKALKVIVNPGSGGAPTPPG